MTPSSLGQIEQEKVQQRPSLVWASVTLPRPLVGHVLYEVGKALVDLSDLDQHVNQVCKVLKQSRVDERKKKADEGEGCPGHLKANVARLVWSQASCGKPDREPSAVFVKFWKALKPE